MQKRLPDDPWSPSDRLAVLRDGAGEQVGATYGGTACLFPIEPSTYVTFGADGREHVIRCRTCLPCRRFEQHRLQRALVETFKAEEKELWEIRIQCSHEEGASLAVALHSSVIANFAPGFFRSSTGIVLIAVGRKLNSSQVRALRRSWNASVTRIRRKRGRRAFASVTSGMLVSRDDYGAWRNRFYLRGLKHPARDAMTRATRWTRGIKRRHRIIRDEHSVRAWMDGVSIHLPAAIAPPKVNRRRGAWEPRVAGGMSSIDEVLRTGTMLAISRLSPAAQPRPSVAARERHTSDGRKDNTNSISGGRYSGSTGIPSHEIDGWTARMTAKARARGKPPDSD